MSTTVMLRHLSAERGAERFVPAVLSWILEAGAPYFEWLLGTDGVSESIERWMHRPSSEFAIDRTVVAELGGVPIGGYIPVDGRDLSMCRVADAVAALAGAGNGAAALRGRLEASRGLFASVSTGDLYLSKLGILEPYRGRGFGRWLLDRFVEQGRARGFGGFVLDVSAGNHGAIELYRSAGFLVTSESIVPDTPLSYLAMRLER